VLEKGTKQRRNLRIQVTSAELHCLSMCSFLRTAAGSPGCACAMPCHGSHAMPCHDAWRICRRAVVASSTSLTQASLRQLSEHRR